MVLNFLAVRAYKASREKTKISQQEVQHLEYVLTPGTRHLSAGRVGANFAN
jgi:hypothetical protein